MKFDCSALNGYEERKRYIMTVNDEPAFENRSPDERMDFVSV